MEQSLKKRLDAAKEQVKEPKIKGHAIDGLERFMEDTRHMLVFDVLMWECPVGDKGDRMRVFLTGEGYQEALESQKRGDMKIIRHAKIINGSIHYDMQEKVFE